MKANNLTTDLKKAKGSIQPSSVWFKNLLNQGKTQRSKIKRSLHILPIFFAIGLPANFPIKAGGTLPEPNHSCKDTWAKLAEVLEQDLNRTWWGGQPEVRAGNVSNSNLNRTQKRLTEWCDPESLISCWKKERKSMRLSRIQSNKWRIMKSNETERENKVSSNWFLLRQKF